MIYCVAVCSQCLSDFTIAEALIEQYGKKIIVSIFDEDVISIH